MTRPEVVIRSTGGDKPLFCLWYRFSEAGPWGLAAIRHSRYGARCAARDLLALMQDFADGLTDDLADVPGDLRGQCQAIAATKPADFREAVA